MFEAIAPVGPFRDSLGALLSLVDETTLHLREDELYAQPVDPGAVATVNQWIDASFFESYEADGGQIGVSLTRLDDYLSKANGDELAHLRLDPETRMLHIDTPAASFQMATIDPESVRNGQAIAEMGNPPAVEQMTLDVEMDGAALSHAIDVVGMVSDHLRLDADPDREAPMHFVGGGDTDTATVEFEKSLHEGSTVPEAIHSLYSLDYLEGMVSPIPDDATVRVESHEEWPMRLSYEYAEGDARVEMVLAPRVQTR